MRPHDGADAGHVRVCFEAVEGEVLSRLWRRVGDVSGTCLGTHTAHRRSYASVGISLSAAGAPRFVKMAVVSAAPPVPALGS